MVRSSIQNQKWRWLWWYWVGWINRTLGTHSILSSSPDFWLWKFPSLPSCSTWSAPQFRCGKSNVWNQSSWRTIWNCSCRMVVYYRFSSCVQCPNLIGGMTASAGMIDSGCFVFITAWHRIHSSSAFWTWPLMLGNQSWLQGYCFDLISS